METSPVALVDSFIAETSFEGDVTLQFVVTNKQKSAQSLWIKRTYKVIDAISRNLREVVFCVGESVGAL